MKMMLQNATFGIVFSVGFTPVVLLSLLAFGYKLRIHKSMLKQLSEFDVRYTTKCTVDSDRPMLEDLLARLFDEIDELLGACQGS